MHAAPRRRARGRVPNVGDYLRDQLPHGSLHIEAGQIERGKIKESR